MRQNHLLLALVAASAMRTSGQTPVQTVPVVITSDYYAQPKVLVLHALNNSGKDIVGYTFVTRYKKADGTIDPMGRVENTTDMLMKEANELIRNALADSTNDHPVAAVLTEL